MANFDAEQFYPTPQEAITKMLAKFSRPAYKYGDREFDLSSKLARPFIDPHGGNGDLLDALVARGARPQDCFAYEINPARRATLQGKGYRVLGADFLEDWENLNFGTWLVNPPWRQDAKHLMTCYRRMRGGHMIALMSTANFENPRTADEMAWANLVAQLQAKGQAEVENFGSIFMDAERKTKAECTCIWLNLPVESVFDPSQFETEAVTEDKTFDSADLVSARFIPAIVAQYRAASRALEGRHQAQAKLNHYLKGIANPYALKDGEREAAGKLRVDIKLNDELLALKQRFWYTIYNRLEISKRAPSHFKDQFDSFAYQNAQLAFSENNIREMMLTFMQNADTLMLQSLEKMFDKLTSHSPKNVTVEKTWKTNNAFKVKEKVISPSGVSYDPRWGGHWSYYNCREFYRDLDRIFAYLAGESVESLSREEQAEETVQRACKSYSYSGGKEESRYFWLKVHKSGTVHIWFKDKELLKKFNHAAAAQKKWIDSYEAESCADQREREQSRQPAEHVEVHYPKHDGPGQLALI